MNTPAISNNSETIGVLDQFQNDLVETWSRLPNKFFFFVLLAAWLALFQFFGNSTFGYIKSSSLLKWLYDIYSGWNAGADGDRQGLWVPFVVLGVLWWRRRELLSLPLKTWWPGLFLVIASLALHVIGYLVQQGRVSALALFVGIYGLTGLAWGWAWLRASFFPFFLLVFCVPFSTVISPMTFYLQVMVSRIAELALHNLLGIDVVRSGTQLFDSMGKYQYEVAAACSGIRSLIAIGTIATIWAFMGFKTWWQRSVLIGLAVPLAVVGNVVRLLTIVIAAEMAGQKAGDAVHEGGPMGVWSLLPYVPAFLGLMAAGKWLGKHNTEPAKQHE